MDARQMLKALRRRWYVPLLSLFLGLAIALGYTATVTPVYQATAKIFVSNNNDLSQNTAERTYWRSLLSGRLETYAEMASTPVVLDPVEEDFGGKLPGLVTAEPVTGASFIDVTTTGADPQAIASLANSVAERIGVTVTELETPPGKRNSPVGVSVIAPAIPPSSPIAPNLSSNLLTGGLLGLVLGIGLVVLRTSLDRSVRSTEQLEDLTQSTPLSVVALDPNASNEPLVALDQMAPRSEAFRVLRTNLQYVRVDDPPRVIVVTSSAPSEGKTTTACNLAITMAQSGFRVCIVDADVRWPKAEEYLGLESGAGLTDVLCDRISLEEVLIPWRRGLLTVLPSGPKPPNPSELLGSQAMRRTLQALRGRFDLVIVDTSPLLAVADASLVAAAADGALLLVRQGKTTIDQVKASLVTLERVDASILGTVFNFASRDARGYGYGYGYGYGNDDKGRGKKAKAKKRSKAAKEVVTGV